jgi:hypothetical protein
MKDELARQNSMSKPERDRHTPAAYGLPIPITDEFIDFANLIWAMRIGEEQGAEAGLRAFLASEETARLCQIGQKVRQGGKPQSATERDAEEQRLHQMFVDERKEDLKAGFTELCVRIGKRCDPPLAEATVRGKFRKMQPSITGKNFREVPLD